MHRRRHTRRIDRYALLFLVCAAALLRLALVERQALWADEVFSLAVATGHSLEHPAAAADPALGDFVEGPSARPASAWRRYVQHDAPPAGPQRVVRAVLLSDTSPPLYYLLLNLWTRALGTGDGALRLFSALWAVACLPLLWHFGRYVGGRRTALAACAFFAVSPVGLFYSTEARMYTMVWFLATSLAWLTVLWRRRGARPAVAALWVLSGAAGLLTHYFFAFVWLACAAWLWLGPGKSTRAHVTAAAVLTGLVVLPWYLRVPESLARWRVTGTWLAGAPEWYQLIGAPVWLAWRLLAGRGTWGGVRGVDLILAAAVGAVGVAALRALRGRLFGGRRAVLWLWLASACLGPLAFDLLRHSATSLIARYALAAFPAAMLLLGFAVSRLRSPQHRAAATVAILAAWAPAVVGVYRSTDRNYEPFGRVGAMLSAWATPRDLVLVHSIPSGVIGLARYTADDVPIAAWVGQLGNRRVPADLEALLRGRARVVLVRTHEVGEPAPEEEWLRNHARLEREITLGKGKSLSHVLYFSPRSGSSFGSE